MQGAQMKLNDPSAYRTCDEAAVIREHLDLGGRRVLELGCGSAWMTRLLAEQFGPAELVATEVDRIQHQKNLAIDDLPGVRFCYGGAEAIAEPDASFDAVFMFKSLHHVPAVLMQRALGEIHRVLRPGGLAYFSEPVYWGDFNAVLSLFHDEREVRQLAFDALRRAVDSGRFAPRAEVFFQVPGSYPSWEVFEGRFIRVTHTEHRLSDQTYQRVKAAFTAHMGPDGAHFLKPHRADILQRV
jgi:ubiquinone/menaquinone biosynthesis C-methylase UbiE